MLTLEQQVLAGTEAGLRAVTWRMVCTGSTYSRHRHCWIWQILSHFYGHVPTGILLHRQQCFQGPYQLPVCCTGSVNNSLRLTFACRTISDHCIHAATCCYLFRLRFRHQLLGPQVIQPCHSVTLTGHLPSGPSAIAVGYSFFFLCTHCTCVSPLYSGGALTYQHIHARDYTYVSRQLLVRVQTDQHYLFAIVILPRIFDRYLLVTCQDTP